MLSDAAMHVPASATFVSLTLLLAVGCSSTSSSVEESAKGPASLPVADPALLGGACSGGTSVGDAVAISNTDCESGLCLVDARDEGARGVYCTVDCTKFACPEGYTCQATTLGEKPRVCTRVPVICGDGAVGRGELCDDGNVEDGDSCSADCSKRPLVVLELQTAEWQRTDGTIKYPKNYYYDALSTAKDLSCDGPLVQPLGTSTLPFLITPLCTSAVEGRNVSLAFILPDAVGTFTLGDDKFSAGGATFVGPNELPINTAFAYGAAAGRPIAGEKGTLVVAVREMNGTRIVHQAGTIDLVIPSCSPDESCARFLRATGRFEVNDVMPKTK